jgi:hypothetical protein
MSIKRDDSTNWTLTYPSGDRNSQMDIEATLDGLLIDGDLILWGDLQDAQMEAQAACAAEWRRAASALSRALGNPALDFNEPKSMESALMELAAKRLTAKE